MSMNANTITSANINAYATDSFKVLARNFNLSVGDLRAIAQDLGLEYGFSKARRTWILEEHPRTVRTFFRHLEDLTSN